VHLNFCLVIATILLGFSCLYGIEILANRIGIWTNFIEPAWLEKRDASVRFWMMTIGVILITIIFLETGTSAWTIWSLVVLFMCYYMAAVDLRDFWLPDHATLSFLIIGMMWSPFELNPLGRIHGFAGAAALFALVGLIVNFIRYRRVAFDNFSGGDMIMGAGIGAWFGLVPMGLILVISFCIGIITNIARRIKRLSQEGSMIIAAESAGQPVPDLSDYQGSPPEAEDMMTSRHVPEPLGVSMAAAVGAWLVAGHAISHALYMHGMLPDL
jgi:hypothetical protein